MKLIRLITEDRNCRFDNAFNDDLLLKPNSKIALQSIALDTINDVIVINGLNQFITYQVKTGFQKIVSLTHATYTQNNFEDLFLDIKNRLNDDMGFSQTEQNNKNLGIEWNCFINNQKKVVIGYKIGRTGSYPTLWGLNNLEFGTIGNREVLNITNTPISTTTNANNARSINYISRGCGYLRTRIHSLDNSQGATELDNGFIIALSKTNVFTTGEITDDMINYGIMVSYDHATAQNLYQTIIDGVFTPSLLATPNVIGVGNVNNDFQELLKSTEFNGSSIPKILFQVYQNGSAAPITLLTHDYTSDEKLYPLLIYRGSNALMNSVRITPSPWENPTIQNQAEETELMAPPRQSTTATLNFLDMPASLASFLNFTHPRIPQVGTESFSQYALPANTEFYTAGGVFQPVDIADAFIVEMLNLKLESYDGLLNQRKNILAVIPKSNADGSVIFETNTPIFIDLNNKNEILLRNIKCRVVRPDYSNIEIQGLASLVLLVDN